jgi:hypothetical protein
LSELEAARWRTFVTCVDLDEAVCRLESCRAPLPPRRTAYCSDQHARAFENNHVWSAARRAARRRAKWTCERCGFKPNVIKKDPVARLAYTRLALKLEVNHIQPLIGAYRVVTCLNHLTNLEVLCHACHVEVTGGQRASRSKKAVVVVADEVLVEASNVVEGPLTRGSKTRQSARPSPNPLPEGGDLEPKRRRTRRAAVPVGRRGAQAVEVS